MTIIKPSFTSEGELTLKIDDKVIPKDQLSHETSIILPIFYHCWKVIRDNQIGVNNE
jgi:hypothetical protein